jgi:hypothetical protein
MTSNNELNPDCITQEDVVTPGLPSRIIQLLRETEEALSDVVTPEVKREYLIYQLETLLASIFKDIEKYTDSENLIRGKEVLLEELEKLR